jgi:hypothetical protein
VEVAVVLVPLEMLLLILVHHQEVVMEEMAHNLQ